MCSVAIFAMIAFATDRDMQTNTVWRPRAGIIYIYIYIYVRLIAPRVRQNKKTSTNKSASAHQAFERAGLLPYLHHQ